MTKGKVDGWCRRGLELMLHLHLKRERSPPLIAAVAQSQSPIRSLPGGTLVTWNQFWIPADCSRLFPPSPPTILKTPLKMHICYG
ncbi:hypothetical protein CEXT_706911 [Caerostris extrusa]|uniref:Uncharacterized protein n=1 Tax=Caerostris extrusa TaxID=172846 RepID=A0AAV4PQ85_CAEEX|nr:hypothetical protein CEXT_706911 [Caerostris extrusa]